MNEKKIKKLIQLVEESDIDILEVSSWGRKVRITRRLAGLVSGNGNNPVGLDREAPAAVAASRMPAASAEAPPAQDGLDESNLVAIKSPMVGTYYSAPAPDANAYVETGQRIDKGQVVCIVEAMKLMNEIESESAGRIAKICIENAQPVEFGQTLFLIDPSG